MKNTRIVAALALLLLPLGAAAQELQPGLYWPLPRGVNILTVVQSRSQGDVTFDPSLPVEQARATINTTALALTHTLSFFGRSANLGVQLPGVQGHLEGLYAGVPTTVDRTGLADPRLQFGVNVYGAPSMTSKEFGAYRLNTIVGVGLTVAAPLGQYFEDKVINLGSNRWAVKPELGVSHAMGPWIVEMMAGVWLFTDNTNFAGGRTRTQDPIGSGQLHLTYRFNRKVWLAGNANYYTGGRTTVGTITNLDFQKNARVGATLSWALNARHALRASASQGVVTTIGGDFTAVALGYNYVLPR